MTIVIFNDHLLAEGTQAAGRSWRCGCCKIVTPERAIQFWPEKSSGQRKTAPDTPGSIMVNFLVKVLRPVGCDGGGDEG
jgi:hypothetical protein